MPERPWTPYAVLCGTELRFGIEIPLIYATAECQNLRIRLVPNSWDSSLAFAVFATLICQINSVFPCKDTKLQKATLFGAVCLVTQSFGFRAKGSGQPGKNSVWVFVFILLR